MNSNKLVQQYATNNYETVAQTGFLKLREKELIGPYRISVGEHNPTLDQSLREARTTTLIGASPWVILSPYPVTKSPIKIRRGANLAGNMQPIFSEPGLTDSLESRKTKQE